MCQKIHGIYFTCSSSKKKVKRKCLIRGDPLKVNRQKQNKKTTTLNMIVHDQWTSPLILCTAKTLLMRALRWIGQNSDLKS